MRKTLENAIKTGAYIICKILRLSVTCGMGEERNTTFRKQIPQHSSNLVCATTKCCYRNAKSPTEFLEVKDRPADLFPDDDLLAC